MKLPNGYGSVVKLSGKRRKPRGWFVKPQAIALIQSKKRE